jgi:hypothetical protein
MQCNFPGLRQCFFYSRCLLFFASDVRLEVMMQGLPRIV